MADDKIRISWEEVQDPRVDERIRQQSAQARAAEHYQQQVAGPAAQPVTVGRGAGGRGFWYNSLVYMTLFGMVGGLLAWGSGEGVQSLGESVTESAKKRAVQRLEKLAEDLTQAVNQERMTAGAARSAIEDRAAEEKAGIERRMYLFSIAFFVSCGGIIAAFIGVAEPGVERNWAMAAFQGSLGLLAGILGGAVVGLFIDALYHALGGGKSDAPLGILQIAARAIGWGLLGMFLSVSAGLVLRSFRKCLCGVAGGLIGGLIGGCLFDPLGMVTHSGVLSRLVAVVAIGALSGLATGLLENAAKTGWVRVLRGLLAGKQFILYRNPTCVGSSPQCEIYLFKDPAVAPRHAALHMVPGGFDLEDLQSGMPTYVNGRPIRRQRLRNDDQVQVGSTVFLFQERRRQP